MPTQTFKTRLKSLKFSKKIIYFASALTMISVFLPWYNDIDKFKIGDSFLGITGPLYLAGFIVLIASVLSFGIITLSLRGQNLPKLPLKEEHFFVFNSGLSLLMLILCASVYFHSKFGINLTDKNAGVGLIMAFISCPVSLFAGILANRESAVSFDTDGNLEPLIDLSKDRGNQDLSMNSNMTIAQAMEKNTEVKTEFKKEELASETAASTDVSRQNNEEQKLWGWGHNVGNSKDKR